MHSPSKSKLPKCPRTDWSLPLYFNDSPVCSLSMLSTSPYLCCMHQHVLSQLLHVQLQVDKVFLLSINSCNEYARGDMTFNGDALRQIFTHSLTVKYRRKRERH
ncbi:hypothetical protein Tco_0268311 [Tanacetum coccineum]